jgi:ketosteroid isomerase-like protein
MKSIKLLLFVFLSIATLTSDSMADEAAERNALRRIKTVYEEAVNTNDISKLKPYVSSQTTAIMVTGDVVEGMDGLESYWKKIQGLLGPGGLYHVEVTTNKTDLFGDTSISTGTALEHVRLGSGIEFNFISSWTAVCRKEGSNWKVYRMQATMDPVSNPFVERKISLEVWWNRGLGFLIGILILTTILFLKRKLA